MCNWQLVVGISEDLAAGIFSLVQRLFLQNPEEFRFLNISFLYNYLNFLKF